MQTALNAQLDAHKTWRHLLGYEGQYSRMLESDFFIAPDGHYNPQSELIRTIDYFLDISQSEKKSEKEPEALCRYQDRYLWLQSQLPNWPRIAQCEPTEPIPEIDLIVVSGYLRNPASFYGHLLINIASNKQYLLDNSLNFGAIIPADANPLSFIINGVWGGYPALFSTNMYIFTHNVYANRESRDAWSYRLRLSPAKRALLIAHLMTLLDQPVRYYFFNKNCAYYVASALELVIDDDLITLPWAIPTDVVESLNQHNWLDPPRFLPAQRTRFNAHYAALTPDLKYYVKQYKKHNKPGATAVYAHLPPDKKIQVIDTLLADTTQTPLLIDRLKLNGLGLATNQPDLHATDAALRASQRPLRLGLGVAQTQTGYQVSGDFRAAYYDLIAGRHSPYSTLEMGRFIGHYPDDSAPYLSQATLVLIEQLDVAPIDRGVSWQLRLDGTDATDAHYLDLWRITAGAGYATQWHRVVLAGLINATAGYYRASTHLYPELDAIVLMPITRKHADIASMYRLTYLPQTPMYPDNHSISAITVRLGAGRHRDYRLTHTYHAYDTVTQFQIGWYY